MKMTNEGRLFAFSCDVTHLWQVKSWESANVMTFRGMAFVISLRSTGSLVLLVNCTGSNFKVDIPAKFPRLRRDIMTVKVTC